MVPLKVRRLWLQGGLSSLCGSDQSFGFNAPPAGTALLDHQGEVRFITRRGRCERKKKPDGDLKSASISKRQH